MDPNEYCLDCEAEWYQPLWDADDEDDVDEHKCPECGSTHVEWVGC